MRIIEIDVFVNAPEGVEVIVNIKKAKYVNEISALFQAIHDCTGYTELTMISRASSTNIREVRYMAFKILHETCGLSLGKTGKIFGKDHSSVHWGINRINDLMDTYSETMEIFNSIHKTFKQLWQQDRNV